MSESFAAHEGVITMTDAPPTTFEERLLRYLRKHCAGKQRAASRQALSHSFRCHDRKLRVAIERLRRAGHAIGVAEGGGYFVCETAAEAQDIVDSYRRRIESECITLNLLRRNYPQIAGIQLVLVDATGQAQLI